ncbi:MAG: hypothetical protein MUO31_04040, partial [Thermodesulfovibrionales bacterium]|nr:hypothetical protein [Thermodesulfovibrionales bacterium]
MTTNGKDRKEDEASRYQIILPCNQKDFGEFVSGLLGKPQTIERSFWGTYELTEDDIQNTYHLVEQRVHQQNDAVLIQFSLKVIYNDNSSVLHNSLQDFLLYREVRPLVPISIHLSWIYLIKFRDKSISEKQVIEMTFGMPKDEPPIYLSYPSTRYHRYERLINIRISHTGRTWATDIESLLSGHVETLLKTEIRYK